MKGKFDAYVLWPLSKKFQNWIVDRSTARDFTVCKICKKLAESPQLIISPIKNPGKKSAQQEAEDMFRIYDKNKDGFISHDELKEVLSELDANFTDIEIKGGFHLVDLIITELKDHMISYKLEFLIGGKFICKKKILYKICSPVWML